MQKEYEPLIQDFLRLLTERFGTRLVSVLVFGSVARGTARPDSDVDVCLVIRDLPPSRYRRHQLLAPVLEEQRKSESYRDLIRHGYNPDIAALLYTPEEVAETKPIFLDMVEEGDIIQDDGTLRGKLESLRQRLRQLGARKIPLADGTYYWLLKPDLKFGEVVEL